MAGAALSLGPIEFQGFEVPAAISFGGRQRMAVRYLANGQRVTDLLGADDAAISFSGILSGPNASGRAREIDTLRILGVPLDLIWNTFLYTVAIANFRAEFKSDRWIPYEIRCSVLSNPTTVGLAAVLSVTDQALSSLNAMYSTVPADLLAIPDARAMLSPAGGGGATVATTGVARGLMDAVATLNTQQGQQEAVMGSVQLNGVMPTSAFLSGFGSAVAASGDVQFLALSQDYLGQAAVLLGGGVGS